MSRWALPLSHAFMKPKNKDNGIFEKPAEK